MIQKTSLGIACALGAAALYGLIPNVVRSAFNHGVPSVETTFFRTSLVAIAFAVIAILRGEHFHVSRAALPSLAGQVAATLVVSVGYLASVQFIPVGLAAIIFFTFPVIILLAAPIVEGHAPGLFRIFVAVFAFAGLAISVGPSFDSLDIRGILLAAAASVFCALQFFSGRSISRYLSPLVFGSLVHLAMWPASLLIALVVGGWHLNIFPGGTAEGIGLLFMASVGVIYVIAYLIHMLSLRYAPASAVAPFFNLEPIVATVVASVFLGERLALNQYVGGGMVLAALVASSLIGTRKTA